MKKGKVFVLAFSLVFVMLSFSFVSASCGDGVCDGGTENYLSCGVDCFCPADTCGDGFCNCGESYDSCLKDCGSVCGDGRCTEGEDCDSCSKDCCPVIVCGDSKCEGDEDCSNCPHDCGSCSGFSYECGDGTCNSNYGETCENCEKDCGTCSSSGTCFDGIQNQGETGIDCGGPCSPCSVYQTCYDGIKNQDEVEIDCGGVCPNCTEKCNPTLSDVKVSLDQQYITKTEKYRKFKPNTITPFDDIVCEVKLSNPSTSSGSCTTPVIKGKLMTLNDPESTESNDANWIEITNGEFKASGKNDGTYEWKIIGWGSDDSPQGWTSDKDILEKIIASKKVKCVAYLSTAPNVKSSTTNLEQTYSNCVHLWGKDDAFGYTFFIGRNSPPSVNNQVATIYSDFVRGGFHSINPFAYYSDFFSEYVDLVKFNDYDFRGPVYTSYKISHSSCKDTDRAIFLGNYSGGGVHILDVVGRAVISSWDNSIIFHEIGHAFCGLVDEYDPLKQLNTMFYIFGAFEGPNCMKNPKWYPYGGMYSNCGYSIFNFKKPSIDSIMDASISIQYNTVSCGYCAIHMSGSSIDSAWKLCETFPDTIKAQAECATNYNCKKGNADNSNSCAACIDQKCDYSGKTTDGHYCFNEIKQSPGACSQGTCVTK